MKQTLFIPLVFAGTYTAQARININFKVAKMHIKSIAYQPGTAGTANYVVLQSDIAPFSPLGILYQDSTYSSGTNSDVEIQFQNPQPLQGIYNFTIQDLDSAYAQTSNSGAGTDWVAMIVEFNSHDEVM